MEHMRVFLWIKYFVFLSISIFVKNNKRVKVKHELKTRKMQDKQSS